MAEPSGQAAASNDHGRSRSAARLVVRGVVVSYAAVLVACGVALAAGTGLIGQPDRAWLFLSIGGLVVWALLAPVVVLLVGWQVATERVWRRLAGQFDALAEAVARLEEHSALSDDARRVLHRQRERALLCRAIEEDLQAGEWDAAGVLVSELADRFGYRAEAEQFRQRIEQSRAETLERAVSEAIARLDGLIIQRRWGEAIAEAERIRRLYPGVPRVEGLRARVEQARALYKSDLERRFLVAAQEDQIDEAMELLRQLDSYLTEAEAERYREVARGVIGKARENLGAQFKLAIHNRRWHDAAILGERIIDEFPATRMAEEVRAIIDTIRQRAADMPGRARAG